jgi:hypothetical protein
VIALNEARRQLDANVRNNHSQVFKVVGWD